MIHTDTRFASAVEALVTELERQTDAEIVVVATPRSGSYRDAAVAGGAAAAWLFLLFLLFSPWHFRAAWIPLDLALVGLGTTWLLHRCPACLKRLTRRQRQHAQVLEGARAAFLAEAVHGTRRHTGVLVYLSALEGEVVVLRDPVLDGRIPGAAWTGLDLHPQGLDAFLALLRQVGQVLARHVPPVAGDNPDEIPNAPRVRP